MPCSNRKTAVQLAYEAARAQAQCRECISPLRNTKARWGQDYQQSWQWFVVLWSTSIYARHIKISIKFLVVYGLSLTSFSKLAAPSKQEVESSAIGYDNDSIFDPPASDKDPNLQDKCLNSREPQRTETFDQLRKSLWEKLRSLLYLSKNPKKMPQNLTQKPESLQTWLQD